jgi:serine/threonine protein kinase/tetratricopeptide (TPR) repeat protein
MAEVSNEATWLKLKNLYFAAAELHGDQREGFIRENCPPGDPLRDELQRLLLAEQQSVGPLDKRIQLDMASTEELPVLRSGTRLGQYKVLEVLGSGGLGVVYRAQDTRLKRVVAVKVLKRETVADRSRQRLMREARIASAFTHPNIVAIYNVGSSDGIDYIAMELVAGRTLRDLIQEGARDIDATLAIAVQIADAMSALHDASIVHRDIKPTNVVVTDTGLVKVLDFGLAKTSQPVPQGAKSSDDHTAAGVMAGTYAYMSPEQAQGKPVDARSDTFAFGALLYELFSGQRAFPGDNGLAVLSAVQHSEPTPLKDVAPDTPRELRALIDRCLRKDPRKRWQSIADVKLLLGDILERVKEERETPHRLAPDAMSSPAPAEGHAVASIAVLPFRDLSPQRDQDYFCEGMSEELINALSAVDGVRVAARSSSFRFAGPGADIRKIGEQLRVDTVLDGSVRKAGNRLRIVAQLVNVRDGYHVWSDRYDRELDDVFAVQDDIARGIVDKLTVSLRTSPNRSLVKRQTGNIDAYSLYLQGRYYWSRRYAGFLQRAMDSFEQAIIRDPSYALAHAGLAEAFSLLGVYAILPPAVAIAKAKPLAERAVALDPTSAETHQAMALVRWYFDWDFDAALRVYAQALTLMPSSGVLRGLYGILLADLGCFDEAVAQVTQARELEPVSALVGFYGAAALAITRPLEHAVVECERVLELDPGFVPVLWVQATALSHLSRHREAIEAAERALALSRRQGFFLACAATVYAAANKRQRAEELVSELRAQRELSYVSPLCLAEVSAALGDVDDAFNWLESAFAERTPFLVALGVSPAYDSLRSDPRFPSLLRRLGLGGVRPPSRHS